MKKPFNFNDWVKDMDQKVVDENGDSVVIYRCCPDDNMRFIAIIDEKAVNLESENLPIYFDVEDPSERLPSQIAVSEFAKDFQRNSSKTEKENVLKCANWFIGSAGIFGHYSFFTKELWRKVKGFKHKDKGEVIAAFLHWWFRYEYGFQTMPVGCDWSTDYPSIYGEDDTYYNSYIQKYMPVFEAYSDWLIKQR